MPKAETTAAVAALAKARAAFSAYKGHFTRALKTFDRQVALVLASEPTSQAVAALETSHDTFVTRYNRASAALDDLIDATIAAEEDDHTIDERDALDDEYSKVEEVYLDAASRLSRGLRRAQAILCSAAGACGGINTVQLVEEEAVDALPSVNTISRPRNTPALTVRVNGYEQNIAALPDTGACLSIISPSWMEEFDLWHKVDTSAPPKLSSATGGVMEAGGTIDLQLIVITQGKAAASTRVTFTVGVVKHGLIIGWEDLIRLGVIHPTFPEPIAGHCGPSSQCGPPPRYGTVSTAENSAIQTCLQSHRPHRCRPHCRRQRPPRPVPRPVLQRRHRRRPRRWNDSGTVVRPRAGHKSFFVMKSGGRMVLKNHRHLRHRLRRPKPPQCGPEDTSDT
jgi:hypothetical protein